MQNDFYSQDNHDPYDLGDFELGCRTSMPNCTLACTTAGVLNVAEDNALLLPHSYSGSSKNSFIILPNQLGHGLSSSPQHTPAPLNRSNFPDLTIGDDARAQHQQFTKKFWLSSLESNPLASAA